MICRNQINRNFPFLEGDFDALTDYEFFCQLVGYVKNYQKEFDDFKVIIDEFKEYISSVDVEKTVNEVLDVRFPLMKTEIINEVNNKINELRIEINNRTDNLISVLTSRVDDLDNLVYSIQRGNITLYDPTTGKYELVQEVIQNFYDVFLGSSSTSITALEFDNLELTATEFDAYNISAIDFDLRAKEILVTE